ncbi:MAG: response regulator [Desulfosarcinaceae bacterium]|jgi:signal transduction histidine kinase/ActR/RegA family two-component response regulator
MKQFDHPSITRDLTIGIILTVIIVSTAAISISYFKATVDAKDRLSARAEVLADNLEKILSSSLWNFDEETVKDIGNSYAYNEYVVGLRIVDSLGNVYYKTDKPVAASALRITRTVMHTDKPVGQMTLLLAAARSKDLNRQLMWSSVFIIFINLISLIVIIRFLLRRFLQKPIRYFSEVVENYGEGNPELMDTYQPPLEFRPFLVVLEEMGNKINAQMSALRESQHELERRVEERTIELATANRELEIEIAERKQAESERIKLQDQLQRAEKMEAIGMLAGGVAHDLNNILSGLVSYPEIILMDLPADSPLRKSIRIIQKSGKKAATIVEDLLTMARRGVAVSEIINLNQVITDYLQNPEHKSLLAYHPRVQVEHQLTPDLFNISGSKIHLFKTIMNLVSNAAEAMPSGGKVVLSTENLYVDKPIRGYDQVVEGDYVVLTVTDSGAGIKPEDQERIFEPFYTKKVMGRSGTGLGMAVVWGTVKDHHGYIDMQSAEALGTTFRLYFPVSREDPSEERISHCVEDYQGHGETILVVDDVEEQRIIATALLQNLGYSVAAVSGGEEAVSRLKEQPFDLLLLDMIMDPGMDGLDTYKCILKFHPHQKAIIASGFSETERVRQAQALGAGEYVKKPYSLEKLALAVKAELNGKGTHIRQ